MRNLSLPLLCRTELRARESLPSLLLRLSKENGYDSPTMIARICRERLTCQDCVTRPTRSQTYQVLANLVRIEAEKLYASSVHRLASTMTPATYPSQSITLPSEQTVPVMSNGLLRRHTWPESDVQFCPLCLQESAHHRLDWIPLAMSVCLIHQCLLIRGCPKCHENLAIADLLNVRCAHCGFDLATSSTVDVSGDGMGLLGQMVILSWLGLHPQPEHICSLPNQLPSALYHFLDGLCRTIMGVRRSWPALHKPPDGIDPHLFPCTSKRDITPAKAYILYTTAFQGIARWPSGFYDFLDAYRLRDGRSEEGYVYRDLHHIYVNWLEKAWRHSDFRFVQEAFDHYLLERYPDPLSCLRRGRESSGRKHRFLE
jgi:hypothetical protein